MALKYTVLASSVLAVWLGRGREHPACLHILSGCEVVHIGAQAHVHAQPFRKLSYAAPKIQSWTTVCNNIKWRLKRNTFPMSLWVACVPLLLLGERWVCLHCGDNDVSTAPEAWLPHSLAVVYPLSLLGITSLIPSASQQYGVHLDTIRGCIQDGHCDFAMSAQPLIEAYLSLQFPKKKLRFLGT